MAAEKDVQNEVLMEFGSREWMRVWRHNVGVARPLHDPKSVVRYGVPGQSDVFGIVSINVPGIPLPIGVLACIECKAKTKESAEQARWGAMVKSKGGIYVVARSVDDVEESLVEWRSERLIPPPPQPGVSIQA